MIIYGIIMIILGLGVLVAGVFLFLGHLNLLNEYHRNNVTEDNKTKYARISGIIVCFGSLSIIASGILGFILTEESFWIMVVVLFFIVAKKFNGKVFG